MIASFSRALAVGPAPPAERRGVRPHARHAIDEIYRKRRPSPPSSCGSRTSTSTSGAARRAAAAHLRRREVAFIVNDSMALAKRLGADGVHLGQSRRRSPRGAGAARPGRADRQDLPRQPPPRDGGGGGGGRLCRLRRLLPDHDQAARTGPIRRSSPGGRACSRSRASRSAGSRPRTAGCWSRPARTSSRSARRLGASGGPGRGGERLPGHSEVLARTPARPWL
jgi:hypothetical protein